MQRKVDDKAWYSVGDFFDYLTHLISKKKTSDQTPEVKVLNYNAIMQRMNAQKIKNKDVFFDKILICPDLGLDKTVSPYQQIMMIVAFLKMLERLGQLPKHFRGIILHQHHFFAFDIEFSKQDLKVSYLNTLLGYQAFDALINEALKRNLPLFFPDKKPYFIEKVADIQKNGYDCGPMTLEFVCIGIKKPVKGETCGETPYLELTLNNGLYFEKCHLNRIDMRNDHLAPAPIETNGQEIIIIDDDELTNTSENSKRYRNDITSDGSKFESSHASSDLTTMTTNHKRKELTDQQDEAKRQKTQSQGFFMPKSTSTVETTGNFMQQKLGN